jgi:transposase
LRAEVARLKMERDIAKKAAAYFAQDVLQSTLGSGK